MANSRIDLRMIHEISERPVQAKLKGAKSKNILVLHYSKSGLAKELVLKFESSSLRRLWWQGLQYFIVRAWDTEYDRRTNNKVRDFWVWQ